MKSTEEIQRMYKERRAWKAVRKTDMKNKGRKLGIIMGIAGILTIGGVAAYLTDYDRAANQFTVGKVEIELQEPEWDPDDHTDTEPGEEIKKDPQIKNTGVNDAFVYLEVAVPMADVIAAEEDGSRREQKEQELFSFEAGDAWTMLEDRIVESNKVYVYAYNKILKAGETSEALFDKMTFLNIIEGQLDLQKLSVPIRAYAIQTAHTGGDEADVKEQARTAYQKYVNQNEGREGSVTR